ncbi:uncharacterized protein LOC143145404 [Ptiloglossa arizonensis]|uniref:uncharacterized protein LOC143145404 n=1 Tax=Ptiloglossa arizonensis TaxID=3350558 RepID=UPI003FA0ADAE
MRFFRNLLMLLMSNERLINKLAESKPMQHVAKIVVRTLVRTGTLHSMPSPNSDPKEFVKFLKKFVESFKENLKSIENFKKKPPK